jgi:hypothetical protein
MPVRPAVLPVPGTLDPDVSYSPLPEASPRPETKIQFVEKTYHKLFSQALHSNTYTSAYIRKNMNTKNIPLPS